MAQSDVIRNPHLDFAQVGDTERFAKTITEFDVYAFAGIVGDFYPVHVDEEFSKKTQFGTRIAQGALSVGLVSTVMGIFARRFPSPGAVSYRYDLKFTAPVLFGDTITVSLQVTEKDPAKSRLIFRAIGSNQRDKCVIEGTTWMKVLRPTDEGQSHPTIEEVDSHEGEAS